MGKANIPTPEVIRQCLDYDPKTGVLTRKRMSRDLFSSEKGYHAHKAHVGKAVTVRTMPNGYAVCCILGARMYVHRVIWAHMTGFWPEHDVDHKNGQRADNRWENLRSATRSENLQNRAGGQFTGAFWHKPTQKWRAMIGVQGKRIWLGVFERREDAAAAYARAKANLHRFQPTVRGAA